ncbi:hypothetical protein M378DRAFT_289372 [Amanita muscaria Koide BX008]|uniref:Uncharacterized protein n=1 Tax=Amanita muscaria (strain Koide BX008) TaxID=946122 RepID=A0A0C2SXM0_AMAMK|nr:hypothetical protein M378DRAFT_289372 [Amanita muscaria Koide BX008]
MNELCRTCVGCPRRYKIQNVNSLHRHPGTLRQLLGLTAYRVRTRFRQHQPTMMEYGEMTVCALTKSVLYGQASRLIITRLASGDRQTIIMSF